MVGDIEQAKATFQLKGYVTTKPSIRVRSKGKDFFTRYELIPVYSLAGVLMSRRLHKIKPSIDEWEEEISYNRKGLPEKIYRYRIEKGRKILYFEIQNMYYSINDLPPTDN